MKWIFILFSPFKPPKLKWYFGKTAVGTPYFLPRKWVKATPMLAHKATLEDIKRIESFNKMNPDSARKIKPYADIYKEKMRYSYAIPKKIGFDMVDIGWKTKWSDTDIRIECQPVISFVFFGYQIAINVISEVPDYYWTSWLYYQFYTDKSLSTEERIKKCVKEYPIVFKEYKDDGDLLVVDYYSKILKRKWLKLTSKDLEREDKLNKLGI
jgi:hypothetical protein